ncbi:MAG: sulfatase-like hydrolase/transferase [Blastochloris sp.]|nr:sulfatase-like hydrolase/transferase [Blastochloris sp.]
MFNLDVTHESGMWPEKAPIIQTDPMTVKLPPYLVDDMATREALARHYDHLQQADERVGQLLAELEEDGLTAETLVVLWSDHGEGLPRHKRWLYDGGLQVPLVLRWPGRVRPGS